MPSYDAILEKIRSGRLSESELLNLYENAQDRGAIEVVEAIRIKLREVHPRAANRLFGAKQSDSQERLELVVANLKDKFDLSKNCVGAGVKAGGEMLSGRKYLDLYISYKNANGEAVLLSLTQDEVSSELYAYFCKYKTGRDSYTQETRYHYSELPAAVAAYEKRLIELGVAAKDA